MNKYQTNKEKAREIAINWQVEFATKNHYMSEWLDWFEFFSRLGKRYGLLKEFKENGII